MSDTTIYKLTNSNGVIIEFIALGGRIKSVKIPDNNNYTDILVGYDSVQEMINGDEYMGAICGRVANRIGNGEFTLNGKTYRLGQNDGNNHLHGGLDGFNAKEWSVDAIKKDGYDSAYKLSYTSIDGEENYPGTLKTDIIYALNSNNEFLIDIQAIADKPTIVNLTSHPYFNLNGAGGGKVFNHNLEINADNFTPLNKSSIPTGEIRSVTDNDMDFRNPVSIGSRINSEYEQIKLKAGLDHNWVINKTDETIQLACKVSVPESGRAIEVYTTQSGIQIYTGMHFDGSEIGKQAVPLSKYCGVALEAQNFADAINKPNFPNSILKPDEKYEEKIIYKFIY